MHVVKNKTEKTLLRMKHITEILSVSKSTIWLWIKNDAFPKPNKINGVSVWKKGDIDEWVQLNTNKKEAV